MKKQAVAIIGAVLLLWNCNLPLESWYEEMTAGSEAPEVSEPLPANNPAAGDQGGSPGGSDDGSAGGPGEEPADPPAPVAEDEIDFRTIHWNDYDVGSWPVEEQPFEVSVDQNYIRWSFDQSGWPSRENVNGNIFLVWKENGRYYGESFEHIRPKAKLISAREAKGGGKLRSKPDDWRPVKGRRYGLVLTSHVRGWCDVKRRTNIEFVTWQRD